MVVQTNPDETWMIDGVSFDEIRKINPNLYGALCKLKDYEAQVLNLPTSELINTRKPTFTRSTTAKAIPKTRLSTLSCVRAEPKLTELQSCLKAHRVTMALA